MTKSAQDGPVGYQTPVSESPQASEPPAPVRPAAAGKPPGARNLPRHVRVMRRISGRGLPKPLCAVAVEPGIEVQAGDGVTMLTDHYIPLAAGSWPTLLVRSPYGRGFPWDYLLGALFAGQGFHVVIQSCRGTGGSGGEFEPFRHEGADGQAAVAWLREQEWFSGALGTIGPSYLGYAQWALAADPPPELRAMVVQVGMHDLQAFLYRGGTFALEDALQGTAAMLSFDRGFAGLVKAMFRLLRRHRQVERTLPLIDAYPPAFGGRVGFFDQWLTHPDADDPYWTGLQAGAGRPTVATSLVSGWQDICLDQTLEQYRRLRDGGQPVRLLVGPWTHTSGFHKGWPVVFAVALGWLRAHLGDGTHPGDRPQRGPAAHLDGAAHAGGQPHPGSASARPPEQPVRVQVGGGGQWRDLADWPPPQAVSQSWYPDGEGRLAIEPPAQASVSPVHYDPAAPTPSVGGPVLNSRNSGPRRNDALEARADVLVFTSAPLTKPLEIIGPVSSRLRVRGSSPYFDIFARLCDVDPRGHSQNVCDGLLRHLPASGDGIARDDTARDGAGGHDADGGSEMTVAMSSTAYRFEAGHRLRLQISGGAHPRFARNTGAGEPVATATRLAAVDIQVIHGAGSPAALLLPVMPGSADPGTAEPSLPGPGRL